MRYFGGTKLGTGGLAKAYADAAKSAVEAAAPVGMALCTVYEAALSFSDHKKAEKAFTVNGIKVLSVTFTDTVRIMAAVRKDSGVDFAKSLSAVTSGNASVTETGERYERF